MTGSRFPISAIKTEVIGATEKRVWVINKRERTWKEEERGAKKETRNRRRKKN